MDDAETPSDADVIQASLAEPERFAALFDRYFAAIHRYAAARLGSGPADDVAAETFLAAFDRRHKYDLDRPVARAWLYGITTHLIGRHWRSEIRMYRALSRTGIEGHDGGHADLVADRVSAQQLQPQLAAGLAALTGGDRDVLLLIACAQLSYDEVALALGIPAGTVGSRLNRARKHLRQILEQKVGSHG
jgi:RNA polymerase sigma-70 factor (ECF subfamily)